MILGKVFGPVFSSPLSSVWGDEDDAAIAYVTDEDGAYLTDEDGAYITEK